MAVQAETWNLSPEEAVGVQQRLRSQVSIVPLDRKVARVAGVDVGVKDGVSTAAVVVLAYPALDLLEVQVARQPVPFPYIPGLLSFRECPVIVEAFKRLALAPDLVLVDGQGIAHPRRLGIASHLGLLLDCPTIGCAKSRLCGHHEEPAAERGSHTPLTDGNEVIGAVLRTRTNVRPLYVSPGHRVTLQEAIHYVLNCGGRYRLPEPTRLAHQAAAGTLRNKPIQQSLVFEQSRQRSK